MAISPDRPHELRSRYQILTFAEVVVAVAGLVGYLLYPRFDLPAVDSAGRLLRHDRPVQATAVFGFGYVLAGFG